MKWKLTDVRHISLRWKLLIPFLFLPAALIVVLVAWGIHSQNEILTTQEEAHMRDIFASFHQHLKNRGTLAVSIAELVAQNPEAQKAMAERDRQKLIDLYLPVYQRVKRLPGIKQFHFHLTDPATSFLRVHALDMYGDDLSTYRHTINSVQQTGQPVFGLEFGITGFGLRGVVPIFHEGRLVGSVELGSDLGVEFLNQLKRDFLCDLTVYFPEEQNPVGFKVLAATDPGRAFLTPEMYRRAMASSGKFFSKMDTPKGQLALMVGSVAGYDGARVAVLEVSVNRTGTIMLIRKYTTLIVGLGLLALLLAFLFVWWVADRFLEPIGALVRQSELITAGEQVPQMEVKVRDEFGVLAQALNKMLSRLDDARKEVESYAHSLEERVQERTADLVRSEEKFRTLVEHIPLVVYRLETNMVRSFVNSHIEKFTGWPPEDMVGNSNVWSRTIHPEDRERVVAAKKRCVEQGRTCELEYRFLDRQGQQGDVLDHAEPVFDEQGRLMYMEGYMLDIHDRKLLEEQTVKAEELKTLSEISSRLAHEFRNPLSVVGLSARRLQKSVAPCDRASSYAGIIVEQVGRLEQIINMIQGFIQPMGMTLVETDLGAFLRKLGQVAEPFLLERKVDLKLTIGENMPVMMVDPVLLNRGLLVLIRNAVYQIPPRGILQISAESNTKNLEIKLTYPAGYLADDQLRHYFYPFTTEEADTSLVDLPLVPVIIHKHNGVINAGREGEDLVAVVVHLPLG
jgi:PAS domain S-box-containing protein